jgi:hypothetical protein
MNIWQIIQYHDCKRIFDKEKGFALIAVVLFPEEDGNRAFLQAQAYEFWSRLRSKYFKENNLTDPLL